MSKRQGYKANTMSTNVLTELNIFTESVSNQSIVNFQYNFTTKSIEWQIN